MMKLRYLILFVLIGWIGACSKSTPNEDIASFDVNSNNVIPKKPKKAAKSINADFTCLLEKAGPSVVSIDSYYVTNLQDGTDKNKTKLSNRESYIGSGIILDKYGYIVTNAHVAEGGNAIKVTLMDKRIFMARLVGSDPISDLALLKIEADNLMPITIGDVKKVQVGQWVGALGAPFGFQFSLTSGVVSAKNRTIQNNSSDIPFLQTDAAINQGNSGGPLLNLQGEAIGVNSHIYSRSGGFVGVAFAIPIDVVMNIVHQLKNTGKVERRQLGVKVDGMSYELAKTFGRHNVDGALILDVLKDSDAQGKLQVGDIILTINKETIKNPEELPSILNLLKPDEEIELYIWRESHGLKVKMAFTQGKNFGNNISNATISNDQNNFKEGVISSVPGLDMGVKKANPDILSYYRLASGLQIVFLGKKAAALGFTLGDIIVRIGNYEINNIDDLAVALKNQKHVPVFLIRNYQPIFIPYFGETAQGNSNQSSDIIRNKNFAH